MEEAQRLHTDGIISAGQVKNIEHYESAKLFSVHWEVRTVLYAGILLLTSGVGVLVYKNIDTIGHQTVLAGITIAIVVCFYYLFKNKQPYNNGEIKNVSPLFDYIALLGCLLFATLVGYLQVQYKVFFNQVWMATLLPSLLFLYSAYAFDHKGLLALGITGIMTTLGLSIAPVQLLNGYDFADIRLLFTAPALGFVLIAVAEYTRRKSIKPHFSFTFHNFAATLLFVACLALLFNHPYKLLSFILLLALCFYFTKYAIAQQSFLFLLYAVVYTYIGITYIVFSVSSRGVYGESELMFDFIYVVASCVGVIFFFLKYKTILRLK